MSLNYIKFITVSESFYWKLLWLVINFIEKWDKIDCWMWKLIKVEIKCWDCDKITMQILRI